MAVHGVGAVKLLRGVIVVYVSSNASAVNDSQNKASRRHPRVPAETTSSVVFALASAVETQEWKLTDHRTDDISPETFVVFEGQVYSQVLW